MARHHRRCSGVLDCVSCCGAKSPLSATRDVGTFVGTGAASVSQVDHVGARGEGYLAQSPAGRPASWAGRTLDLLHGKQTARPAISHVTPANRSVLLVLCSVST